ncbi:MAG: bifunctional diaminohydroxyphosphoribosylaminopyrimidine deaminase/5-amino-6-(5-phosphoribosylamino)uracil reductase RibD [Porphyromonadaceae bacterium]|nr:bifunctional diaminohydroxyphosphoribosylaminopyrimidine deaminase/5-amino-6-(5-phosphoribosylamino)uracil reductase RibD [Porphyromonadaceae bacterium]
MALDDKLYMLRALELAALGQAAARPNPMVGAVLVHKGEIIGEGYHHAYGEPHAEVMAIRSVRQTELLSHSTLYVSLEPCSHYGKTPPCSELIIKHSIPRVVVAMLDPYPAVSGRGIEMLRQAGIEVEVGLLEEEALRLNAPFVCQYTQGRPFITLKWAESQDGFMDKLRLSHSEPAMVFSSAFRLRLVHRERMMHQAILVGYRTALLDNPSLTNRLWHGRHPIRIVLDPHLSLPRDLRIFTDEQAPTWVLHDCRLPAPSPIGQVRYIGINLDVPTSQAVTEALHAEGIQSVFVEGGARTLQSFIDQGLYDCLEREVSPIRLGEGVPAPHLP